MAGYLPDGVTQADIDRHANGDESDYCSRCKEHPCACCQRCGAAPDQACTMERGYSDTEDLPI